VVRERALRSMLVAIQAFDRLRLRARAAGHPGLEIDPAASTNLAAARYRLEAGARLRLGAGVVTERLPGALQFVLGPGAQVDVGAGTWLRSDLAPLRIYAFEGARIHIGPDCFLNGCHLSAKRELRLGRHTFVGPGSRIFDGDQHDLDADRRERVEPVAIGDHVWIAADVTILRGVSIGEHSVVGARSLVTGDLPPHSLAFGQPARRRGDVGDRSRTR
jgi:acetyltransferase-like isoleucine patch superfamily enzyme